MTNSSWRKFLTQPGNIRAVAIEATTLMQELSIGQSLTGEAQAGYCDAVIGAMLIASAHKSNEAINLNAQGSGLYRQAIVDASPEGRVRGFLIRGDQPVRAPGLGPWGTGVLSVLYTKKFEGKAPYTGMVSVDSGYLDEAINAYYRDSEQLASMVGLHVEIAADGKIAQARGALLQALGGAEESERARLAQVSISQVRDLAKLAGDFAAFETQAQRLLAATRLEVVETQNLVSFCNCSRERIERALLLSGEADVLEALGEDPVMTITCDFCRREYQLAAERVRALFKQDPSRLQ